MTDSTLAAFVRRASRLADRLFDADGAIPMIWLLERANGEQVKLATPICVEDEADIPAVKDAIAHTVRKFCHENDVWRYVQIAEAWTLESTKGSLQEAREELEQLGSLANHPQRQEIVVLSADDGRDHVVSVRAIIRPASGKAFLGKLGDIERVEHIDSRFVDLLPQRAHTQH